MSDSSNGAGSPGGFRPDPGGAGRPEGAHSIDSALDELQRRRRRPASRRAAAASPEPAGAQPEPQAEPAEHRGGEAEHRAEPELPSPFDGESREAEPGAFEDGEPAGEGDGAAEPGGGEPAYTVMVEGQPRAVPVSELIAGYMRSADYTKKTQSATDVQRQFAEAFQTFTHAREQLEQKLSRFTTDAAREFEQPVDWVKLAQSDPMAWAEKRARYDALKEAEGEQQRLVGLRQAEDSARKQEMLQAGHRVLVAAIPGWKEPAQRTRLQTEMKEFAATVGYSPQELAADILDPRQLIILHDAMQYRRMTSRRVQPSAPERQPTLDRRGATPAPQPTKREQEAERHFEQRPSVDNALAVLKARQAKRTPRVH